MIISVKFLKIYTETSHFVVCFRPPAYWQEMKMEIHKTKISAQQNELTNFGFIEPC